MGPSYRVREELVKDWPAWLSLMGSFILTVWVLARLLPSVLSHGTVQGLADDPADLLAAAITLPLLTMGIYLWLLVAPLIDPKRATFFASSGVYRVLRNLLVIALAVVHGSILANGFGYRVDVPRVTLMAIALFFVYLGSALPRVPPNWIVGVRFVWALKDERVWWHAQRLGGRLVLLTGLATLVTTPFSWFVGLVILVVGLLVAIVVTYRDSKCRYEQLHDRGPVSPREGSGPGPPI